MLDQVIALLPERSAEGVSERCFLVMLYYCKPEKTKAYRCALGLHIRINTKEKYA